MIITYTKMLENYDQVNDNIMEVLNKSLADTSRKKEEMMMTLPLVYFKRFVRSTSLTSVKEKTDTKITSSKIEETCFR
ncbi:hypothetical protein TNCT_72681 [Trichonephila clavata]|uniref:Uncharacterized protein n=1 Tax=Trichonephila clavata TaxID=2740835 RepID=A0A8X6FJA6_TRICU|nr:hypothetical protein TNCT_72681 [Trichonephila clavata]